MVKTLTITNEIIYKNNPTFTKSLSIAKYSFGEKYGDGNKIKEENGDRILKIEEEKITIKTNGIVYGAQGSGSLSYHPHSHPCRNGCKRSLRHHPA